MLFIVLIIITLPLGFFSLWTDTPTSDLDRLVSLKLQDYYHQIETSKKLRQS